MFGIGGGELVVILIVTLLAVGPDRMPTLLKAVGRGLREMRKATRELQSTVGLDELMKDDTFRDPLGLKSPPPKPMKPVKAEPRERASTAAETPASRSSRRGEHALTDAELARENPEHGVDIDFAEARASEDANAKAPIA